MVTSGFGNACRRAGAALALAFALMPTAALAQARPSIESFFQNPSFADARLSPSGRHVAMAVSAAGGGRTRLVVVDAEKLTAKVVGSFTDADVGSFDWVNDDQLVFSLRDWQTGQGDMQFGPGLFAVSRDGGDFLTLVERSRDAPKHLSGLPSNTRLFALTRARTANEVIVAQPRLNLIGDLEAITLLRQDTTTGRAVRIPRPGNTVDWLLDDTDTPRVTVTRDANRFSVLYADPTTQQWRTLKQFDAFDDDSFWPVALDSGGTLYVVARNGRDTGALYRFDLKANALDAEPIVSIAGYDLQGGLVMANGRLIGVRYQTDGPATVWFDDELKQVQKKVDALLPATVNQLSVGARQEGGPVLVYAFSDVDPGRYLLFNRASGKLTELGRRMAGIDPARMAQRDMVRYQARDGLAIPAYLTLPKGAPRKDLPLVVLVHGGPWVRGGSWNWEADVQFLASRGYAVLEPEFRGSTGFGHKHFKAGWKQWGLAMQDDLADGARWAVAQGIADPRRICIAGASYGGYATLMGLLKEPELFRCGIDWVGVTDIDLLYSIFWGDTSDAQRRYGMPVLIGDRDRDAAQFRQTSPLTQAARIRQPLLLAYGGADRRVPIEHGISFRNAVQKTNSQVEWVEYTEEGHGWALLKNRVDFWGRVEKFLDRNIGPR